MSEQKEKVFVFNFKESEANVLLQLLADAPLAWKVTNPIINSMLNQGKAQADLDKQEGDLDSPEHEEEEAKQDGKPKQDPTQLTSV